MTGLYPVIDLTALPTPAAIDIWSFDGIVTAELQDFQARMTAAGQSYTVSSLETDPAVIIIQASAYREGLMRQRVNDAVLATSLAWSENADVDVIAANYNTFRAPNESDASLKQRAQLAWEALSLGGSYGGYRYRALSAAPADLIDVAVYGPEVAGVANGEVRIVLLGRASNGQPPPAAMAAVQAAFSSRHTRKVNDNVTIVAATPAPWSVDATLILSPGADPNAVVGAQTAALQTFATARTKIGATVSQGNIEAVLGFNALGLVYDIEVRSPSAIVGGSPFQAPVFSGARIVWQWRT